MHETILVVSPDSDNIRIVQAAATEQSVETIVAHTYREALSATAKKTIALIFCERDLPDGSWKDLLSRLVINPEPPKLVVVAEPCDRALWAEALNLGAHDVIAKPLHKRETQHVIAGALLTTRSAKRRYPVSQHRKAELGGSLKATPARILTIRR
jgi:DNA-binding response OmpR family regulator